MAITVDLEIFCKPGEVLIWLCKNCGSPGNDKWSMRDLRYIDFQDEMYLTFVLLNFELRKI